MPITPAPEAPSTDDPDNFDPEGDAFLAWMENNLVPEINALEANVETKEATAVAAAIDAEASAATALGASAYTATTAATLNLALTSQSFTLQQTGKGFAVNDEISLVCRANRLIRMRATLTAFNAGTGACTATITKHSANAASATGWVVMASAYEGLTPDEVAALSIAFAVAL